jgi:hypothetical protein
MGPKAMMLPEPYFPLIILFSHYSIMKTKNQPLEQAPKNIVLYKTVYFSLFLLVLSLLMHLSCNKPKVDDITIYSQAIHSTRSGTKRGGGQQ